MKKSVARKKNSNRSQKRIMTQISGLRINYTDTDPLAGGEDQTTIKALPYGHKNYLLIPDAGFIFQQNREFVFKNKLKWVITVTPISITGDEMRSAVEHIARCKCDEITDSVLSYIEFVMGEIDQDFYSHWLFCCEIGK